MSPLLDAILEHVPAPPGDPAGQFAMLVTMTERDSFLGRVATGRIASGQIKIGDKIRVLRHSGESPFLFFLFCFYPWGKDPASHIMYGKCQAGSC